MNLKSGGNLHGSEAPPRLQMDNGQFVKVFDVLDSGYKDWYLPAIGLVFVFIGLGYAFFPNILRFLGIPYFDFKERSQRLSRYVFPVIAILVTSGLFLFTYPQYIEHRRMMLENRCLTVDGPVKAFAPRIPRKGSVKSFFVDGVEFRYSDERVTDAFNNTSLEGGPIKKRLLCQDLLRSGRQCHFAA